MKNNVRGIEKMCTFASSKRHHAMTRRTQEIIDAIRPELQRVVPEGSQVLLFGSRARGDEREDSDFDILVLLDREGRATTEDNMGVGYDVNVLFWNRDYDVGTLVQTKKEWSNQYFTPFYHNVMKEAVAIV